MVTALRRLKSVPQTRLSSQAVRDRCRKALANGGVHTSPTVYSWDIAGRCERPVFREQIGRAYRIDSVSLIAAPLNTIDAPSMTLELTARCRSCGPCLRQRANLWRQRATAETRVWPRTWFGTLTLRPGESFRTLAKARLYHRRREVVPELESENAQFAAHVNAIGPEIGLFLKRVRKNTGARIRYLLVAEQHKSGLPHFHMLVHQCAINELVRYDDLKSQWLLGFSQWKLTDAKAASYVCKYLSKSLRARVRASIAYGECPNALSLVTDQLRDKMTPPPICEAWDRSHQESEGNELSVSRSRLPGRGEDTGLSTVAEPFRGSESAAGISLAEPASYRPFTLEPALHASGLVPGVVSPAGKFSPVADQ